MIPDKNEKKIIHGVLDFVLSGKGLIMLTASVLDCNGSVIPVTLQGKRYIDRIINERFVFLSNGDEVEVIDVISQRNIYFIEMGKLFHSVRIIISYLNLMTVLNQKSGFLILRI